jgi:hypothetical protein
VRRSFPRPSVRNEFLALCEHWFRSLTLYMKTSAICSTRPTPSRFNWLRKSASAAALILTGQIQAANINWDNSSGDSLWSTPANWSTDALPTSADIAVLNLNSAQTIQLDGTTQTVLGILFNQAVGYNLQNGSFVLSQLNQTGNANNAIQSTVTVTTPSSGANVLTSNVTTNTLQLQGMLTAGGVTKTGNGMLRLGTSGTGFNGAITGDLVINGGTLQVSAANTSGVNNPMATGGEAGTIGATNANVVIGANGVTFSTTHSNLTAAGGAVTYDWGRNIIANNNSFTWNADRAAGLANSGVAQVGTITLGNAMMTTTSGNGFSHRTDGLILNPGSTTTLNLGATLQVSSLVGDAASKIIKNGTGELRLLSGTSANGNAANFAGDFDLNQGTLALVSEAATMHPLGNAATVINITNATNTPTVSMRADASTTFAGVNIAAGNNNFNVDVRNVSSATNGLVMTGGDVSMGNATMNVIGDRAQARFTSLTITPGATLTTLNVNNNGNNNGGQHLRIDALVGDSQATLRKNGGQNLTVGAHAASYAGRLELNGGTTIIEGASSANPLANLAGPITFLSGSTLSLRSAASFDFGDNADLTFAPNVLSSTLDVRRYTGSATGQAIGLGDVHFTAGANRTLTVNQADNFTATFDSITVGAGATAQLSLNANVTVASLVVPADSTFNKLGGNTLTLNTNNADTALGAINLKAGVVAGTVAGSLGSAGIMVGNTTVNSTGFLPDFSRLSYNAAGASAATGVDATAVAGGVIDLNANPTLNDVFMVGAHGRIQGDATQLSNLTIGSNLFVQENAVLLHDSPSSGGTTIQNVGTLADESVYYGISATAAALPTFGDATPWKGLSSDNSARTVQGASTSSPALINVNGGDESVESVDFYLQAFGGGGSLNLGTTNATDASYRFVSTDGPRFTLGITGAVGTTVVGFGKGGTVSFNDPASMTNIATAVDKIVVDGSMLLLGVPQTLGGVSVDVKGSGVLDIANGTGNYIDGDVLISEGGALVLNDTQPLDGGGAITIGDGGKLDIVGNGHANILTGGPSGTQRINFSGSNHTVRFSAENIEGLDAAVADTGATFVVSGGATTSSTFGNSNLANLSINQQTGLSTNGGVITNDGTSRGLNAPLTIGANGVTFAASRNTSLVIGAAVFTIGDVKIGSNTAIDGRDKSYNYTALSSLGAPDPYNGGTTQVVFGNDFAANNVVIENSNAAFTSAATNITGSLTATGGVLYLDGGGPVSGTVGQLTPKLIDGSFAPGGITLGNFNRTEMKVDIATSNGSRVNINQAITIDGDANPQDNRRFWISRNSISSATDTGINFNNVTLNSGAGLAIDEDATDVRMNLKLMGNATVFTGSANDAVDFLDVTRDSSAVNPTVLTLGRINQTGISGFNSGVHSTWGTIGAGVEVNIVRGQIQFMPGSALDGIVRTYTAPATGDSFVISSSGGSTSATTIGGSGRVELGRSLATNGPEDFELRGTEVGSGTAPLHTHSGEVRIVDDGTAAIDGIIRANRANDTTVTARTAVSNVQVEANGGVQFATANGAERCVHHAAGSRHD